MSKTTISWEPYSTGVVTYTVNVGTGYVLFETLFPVHVCGGDEQAGITTSFTINYSYDANTGNLYITPSGNRYTNGNVQTYDIYTIDYSILK